MRLGIGLDLCTPRGGVWSPIAKLAPAHGWDVSQNTGADNSTITSVTDLGSASARNLTPTAATREPLLKLAIKNGKNAALFDGSNDHLGTTSFAAAMAQPFYVFWVGQSAVSGTNRYFDATNRPLFGNTNVAYQQYAGTGPITGGTPDTSWHCFACLFSGASSQVWRDDVSIITGDAGAATLSDIFIGADPTATFPHSGYFGEAWTVAGANVTAALRSEFYTQYAKPKWGL